MRVRGRPFQGVAALCAFVFCVPSLALLARVGGLMPAGEGAATSSAMSDVAFGVLGVVLLCPAFARLARGGPDAAMAFAQLVIVALALLFASVSTAEVVGVMGALGVVAPLALLWALHPNRRSLLLRRGGWGAGGSRWMLGCALVLVVPAWAAAAVNAAHGRDDLPPRDSFAFVPSHWSVVTAMLLASGVIALLAATQRTNHRSISALSVAVAVLLFGVASIINPEVPSSGGRVWGVAAIAWTVVWFLTARLVAGARKPV